MLVETLHNLRCVVAWKLEGTSDEAAKRSLVPSLTTLMGVANHLARVEMWWFQDVFAGRDIDYGIDWDEDPDAEFRMTDEHTIAGVLDDYEAAIAESDAIVAAASLDDVVHRNDRDYTLRWILVHMIDETARHAGHMDILREQLDGATGYFPGD